MVTSGNDTPEPDGPGTTAAPPPTVRVLHAAEHAIEAAGHAVEEVVERAQVSLARRLGARGRRIAARLARVAGVLALVAGFAGGLAILALRYYVLPNIDQWRPTIESAASRALHARVAVGRIEADWQGLRPRLLLWDVSLRDEQGSPVLALPQVDAVVGWLTLLTARPHLHSLLIDSPDVEVRRLADGRLRVAGMVIDPRGEESGGSAFLDWLLAQRRIAVRDAHLRFIDEVAAPPVEAAEGPPAPLELEFADVNLVLERGITEHRFALQLRPPGRLSGPVDLRGEFTTPWTTPSARVSDWTGRLFAQVQDLDLPQIDGILHLAPADVRIAHATGAMRAWTDFSLLHADRVLVDFALRDVDTTLRPDLQPLQLAAVRGRFTHSSWTDSAGEGREFSLQGLSFEGPGIDALAPTDLSLRLTQPRDAQGGPLAPATRLQASRLVLSDLSRMAMHVPLPPEWIRLVERTAAHGLIENLVASWEGSAAKPARPALKASFRALGASLDRALFAAASPGDEGLLASFENLSGQVDLQGERGTLRLEPGSAHLTLPGLLEDPEIVLDRVAARLAWDHAAGGALQVRVESASIANADFDIEGSGAWRAAGVRPPDVEANARIARARLPSLHRYLPSGAEPALRRWLTGALLEGEVTDGSLRLHGDPRRLPFADEADGNLEVDLHVASGKLDFAPPRTDAPPRAGGGVIAWPALTGIDAQVRLRRNQLRIDGRHALAYGYNLADIGVQIDAINRPEAHLLLDGTGSGPLGQMLRYLGDSPLNVRTGGWMAMARGGGATRLHLRLDIPLAHSIETTADGSVQFQGNEFVMRPDIAPFTALTGKLEFTHRGVRFPALRATYLGGEASIDGDTRPDGTVVVHAQGSATPQGARHQIGLAPVRRLLDHARGVARYRAALSIRRASTDIVVDSDLAGMAIDLPEPLRKAAAESRTLHYEDIAIPGSQPLRDRVQLTLGSDVLLDLQRSEAADGTVGPGAMRIDHGVLSIGAPVGAPESGMLLSFDQPRLDLDRWIRVLEAAPLDSDEAAPEPRPAAAGAVAAAVAGSAGSAAPGSIASQLAALDFVAIRTPELTIDGKSITSVILGATRLPDNSWQANVDADQASGSVLWSSVHGGAGRVTAKLARLGIPERQKTQGPAPPGDLPTDLPELDIQAEQFELGSIKLGRLEVQAQNQPSAHGETWQLQRLAISNPDGHLAGSGQWQRDASGARSMALKFTLGITNGGGLLGRFGFAGLLRNTPGKLEGDVSWNGTPFALDFPSLSGRLHLQTEKGQFLKKDAGAGRLLGVLSLQSIAHRVTGDFRDVFAEGFAFDSITADATIASGHLATKNFIMQGVNAKVRIEGTVDLEKETQDLRVVVLPNVNVGGAALVTVFINPAVGLTALLADLILRHPIEAGLTHDYEVTGSWADPQVQAAPRNPPAPPAPPPAPPPASKAPSAP
jgi:uncharacterized protein (TIGR02099 family)